MSRRSNSTEGQQMSFVEAFPVRMSVSQTPPAVMALTVRALASGASTPVWLAKYDHVTSSWRTRQACLVSGWEEFSGTFPACGMTQNGELFELAMLDAPQSDIGSGLLPSPCARDGKDVSSTSAHLAARMRHQPSAATQLLVNGLHWSMISEAYGRIMGFPSQWNAGAFINSVTPSSQRSLNSSDAQSSKRKRPCRHKAAPKSLKGNTPHDE